MLEEGYQPNKGALNELDPPKGGSGVSNMNNLFYKIRELIIRYEIELEEGNYSVVDGSSELERVIKDLKKLIK